MGLKKMKTFHRAIVLLSAISIASLIHAYEYKFKNDTDFDVLVGIQFTGDVGDPIYKKLIKKGTEGVVEFPGGKAGFCLKNVFYIKNPTQEQQKNPDAEAWKAGRYVYGFFKNELQNKLPAFIKSLRSYVLDKGSKIWPSGCGSVDVRIIQDKNNNVFFAKFEGSSKYYVNFESSIMQLRGFLIPTTGSYKSVVPVVDLEDI
jgi:hypothetical protein